MGKYQYQKPKSSELHGSKRADGVSLNCLGKQCQAYKAVNLTKFLKSITWIGEDHPIFPCIIFVSIGAILAVGYHSWWTKKDLRGGSLAKLSFKVAVYVWVSSWVGCLRPVQTGVDESDSNICCYLMLYSNFISPFQYKQ